jgi:hypothetical protein
MQTARLPRPARLFPLTLALFAGAALALTGCGGGGGGGGPVDPSLVGNWRMTDMRVDNSATFPPSEIGWAVDIALSADGGLSYTETWQGKTESTGGTWSAENGTLSLEGDWFSWRGPYTLSGDEFSVSVANYAGDGKNGTFIFRRQ